MDVKRRDSAGETLHLPGDQRGDGEGISKRGVTLTSLLILKKRTERVHPMIRPTSDPDNISFAI